MGARLRYSAGPAILASSRPKPPPRQVEDKSERNRFYAGAAWRRLRIAFLGEHPLCAWCLASGRHVAASIVHHKIERLECEDLALDWDNLEALCSPCHTRHHKTKGRPH